MGKALAKATVAAAKADMKTKKAERKDEKIKRQVKGSSGSTTLKRAAQLINKSPGNARDSGEHSHVSKSKARNDSECFTCKAKCKTAACRAWCQNNWCTAQTAANSEDKESKAASL